VPRSAQHLHRATVVFHDEWERLEADQFVGELLLIYQDEESARCCASRWDRWERAANVGRLRA
jgi:hypothetical protein